MQAPEQCTRPIRPRCSVNVSLYCAARSRSGAIPEALGVEGDGCVRADDRVVGANQHRVLQGLDERRPGSVASIPSPFRYPTLPRTVTPEVRRIPLLGIWVDRPLVEV